LQDKWASTETLQPECHRIGGRGVTSSVFFMPHIARVQGHFSATPLTVETVEMFMTLSQNLIAALVLYTYRSSRPMWSEKRRELGTLRLQTPQ